MSVIILPLETVATTNLFLEEAIFAIQNILIVGRTSIGKTIFIDPALGSIPLNEKIFLRGEDN